MSIFFSKESGLLTEDKVLEVIRQVKDPELHRDLVTLNMIKGLKVEPGRIALTLELTTPACPFNNEMERELREALQKIPGVKAIDLKVTSKVWIGKPQLQGDLLPGVKNVIAVASGKGGVGKSTVAVNLALALAEAGSTVGLFDADIYGPTVPKLLKINANPRYAPGAKLDPALSFHDVRVMSIGLFIVDNTPMMWRGPMMSHAIKQFLGDVNWGNLDYLIVDLPPGTGDASITVAQTIPLTGVIIVSTPQEAALDIATKALKMFRRLEIPIIGVVENMSHSSCPHCGGRLEIFGAGGAKQTSEQLGTAFLGEIPLDSDIRIQGDAGDPIVVSRPESPSGQAFKKIAKASAGRISVIAHARTLGKAPGLM